MNYEGRNERSNAYDKFRGSMHIGMGIIYLLLGTVIVYVKYYGAIELSSGMAYSLGSLMIIYGIFRLWRGIANVIQQRKRP